nr:hypothetical protein [uncultured Massilia sp.]
MNIFRDFYLGISPEDWEFFAGDFLSCIGYQILRGPSRGPDGGRDLLVYGNGKTFLVSCKYKLVANKAVGTEDEESIVERLMQNDANGFIGFYSTLISTPLDNRFEGLRRNGIECIVFDGNNISDYLPNIPSFILQKYGLPNDVRFVMNVSLQDYQELPCKCCGKDILNDTYIAWSLAAIVEEGNGCVSYFYGCKACLPSLPMIIWVEVSQALHQEQLINWNRCVKEYTEERSVNSEFYKNKNDFESAIQQRMYPSNWGRWLPI